MNRGLRRIWPRSSSRTTPNTRFSSAPARLRTQGWRRRGGGRRAIPRFRSDEPGLEAHLATFFEQDYSEYEILFCTRSPEDAGLATARRVAARYPKIPARFLFTGGQPNWINAKAASMERMLAESAHEILVISDSD